MFKFSFLLLLLTIPFLDSTIYFGLPLWVYTSLSATTLYALVLIFVIEKRWNRLKGRDE
ncbi:MAG: hypothetical protein U9P72_00060 [Campylobacterota bacterium]|nr:hypothetical protein [Campylobacterota bacterium]